MRELREFRLAPALWLVLLAASAVTTASPCFAQTPLAFPPRLGGELAVSEGILGPAVGFQGHQHIASNGNVALAIWSDSKGDAWCVRASLLDASGNPLSPTGQLLEERHIAEGLYWNGTEFVALLTDGSKRTRVRLAADGSIIDKVVMGMPVSHELAAIAPDRQRLLFIARQATSVEVAIADRHAEMVGDVVRLASVDDRFAWRAFAAVRDGEFVVLRLFSRGGESSSDVYADRIRMDGTLVSSVASNLTLRSTDAGALAGGGDGYLLVTQKEYEGTVTAYRLSLDGVLAGEPMTLAPADPDNRRLYYQPVVVRDGARYLIAWHLSFNHGESEVRIAELADGASAAVSHRIAIWPGITTNVALGARGSQRFVLASVNVLDTIAPADLYAIPVTPALQGGPPRVVAWSVTEQRHIDAAAGDNGFGIVWTEDGPDMAGRVFFRRVSRTGAAQGVAVQLARVPYGTYGPHVSAAIASNGPVYLLLWSEEGKLLGRRLAAATGAWNDAEPFVVGVGWLTGRTMAVKPDEAALVMGTNEIRRIRFAGDPVTIAQTGLNREHSTAAVLATSGDGYLMVWSEGYRVCSFPECFPEPFDLLAARLAPDGMALDPVPIVLENRDSHPDAPTVAWAGDRYLVVWESRSLDDTGRLRGATVSADGVVLEANDPAATPIPLDANVAVDDLTSRVVADGDSFVLVSSGIAHNRTDGYVDAVRFPFDAPLRSIVSLPRTVALPRGLNVPLPAVAVRTDGTYLLGWVRAGDDGAPRAFFQIFGSQERRRPARP